MTEHSGPVDTDAVKREIESFMRDEYNATWHGEDTDAFTNIFVHPWSKVTNTHGLEIQATPADTDRWRRGEVERLKAKTWVKSGWDEPLQIAVLASDLAMVYADFSRRDEKGTLVEGGRAYYTVTRLGGEWKFIAMTYSESEAAAPS